MSKNYWHFSKNKIMGNRHVKYEFHVYKPPPARRAAHPAKPYHIPKGRRRTFFGRVKQLIH